MRMARRAADVAGPSTEWWKEAVVYEIYPHSFQDSDGDGVGDLRGITSRIGYLRSLGVDVVWLTPIYPSPGVDNGYDISDYRSINPRYGTFADWEALRDALHAAGIRLIMDLVVNHTSELHPWFMEARSARDNPYRDYYIWRPPRNGGPPNNWASAFGGSAWQFDERTGEYYLHIFSPSQPDLNWENPAVRAEVYSIMEWWLERGVDGFRMDVINMISKVPGFPDAPVTGPGELQWGGEHFLNGPRLLEYLREMQERVLSRYDVMTVGEAPGVTTEHALDIAHVEGGPLNMLLHFEHVDLGSGERGKWSRSPWMLRQLKHVVTRWQNELHGQGWNCFYLSNHDQPRAVSRFGDDTAWRLASAKLLGTFLLSLQCTPYIYQGEEIGMANVRFPHIDEYRDIETINFYEEAIHHAGYSHAEAMAAIHEVSRDNARTPMQWSPGLHAGFTHGAPWIGVNPDHVRFNVLQEEADPGSVLHYYRRLIRLRRANPVLIHGRYELIAESHDQVFAYLRHLSDTAALVLLNFSDQDAALSLPSSLDAMWLLAVSNYDDATEQAPERMLLRPWEARIYIADQAVNAQQV
jgi:oligo-1,6-glucosidase